MTNKFCFEPHDRCIGGIIMGQYSRESNNPFGGFIVFCGDFIHIWSIIPKGSKQDIVHASLCSSNKLWSLCRVLNLTKNMHLHVFANI